ncbi:MAG: tRNA 2-selenouridine(34) synthase MnmH [Gammaproteobacteria bacterium]|nr:MAG: tRNA 2-selenouridine(34) synthase MnmH [Gammaproteobacteria bacterium]
MRVKHDYISKNNFDIIFKNNIPLLDVRAPIEFVKGALPNSINIPLLNNKQREQIGICYKKYGKKKAMDLGYSIFDNQKITHRQQSWDRFFQQHKNAYLYCARGGQRSKISQQWLTDYGIKMPRIEGGFKALRQYLLQQLDDICINKEFVVIGGLTGVNKTTILPEVNNSLDLEKLANHKGSVFGNYATAQPKQINFENSLITNLMKINHKKIIIEDESAKIGKINLPYVFWQKKQQSPLVILKEDKNIRLNNLYQSYVTDKIKDFENYFDKRTSQVKFKDFWHNGIDKIKDRLGGGLHQQIKSLLEPALMNQDKKSFIQIINLLTDKYYDPLYQHQLDNKKDKIIFTGNRQQVIYFLQK